MKKSLFLFMLLSLCLNLNACDATQYREQQMLKQEKEYIKKEKQALERRKKEYKRLKQQQLQKM